MRGFLKVIAGFVFFWVLVCVGISFIPVDTYRKKVVQIVNERINGQLSLGQLKLTAWTGLRVQTDALELKDLRGKRLLKVDQASLRIPWFSFLSGSPLLTVEMNAPYVSVEKAKDGSLAWTKLVKETDPSKEGAAKLEVSKNSESSEGLPRFVQKARLGLKIKKAELQYEDLASDQKASLHETDIEVPSLGLEGSSRVTFRTRLDSEQSGAKVRGLIEFKLALENGASWDASLDLSALEILVGDSFQKKSGSDLKWSGKGTYSTKSVDIQDSELKALSESVKLLGHYDLTGTSAWNGAIESTNLKPAVFGEWIPAIKAALNSGEFGFQIQASSAGGEAAMKHQGALTIRDIVIQNESLKEKLKAFGALKWENEKLSFDAIQLVAASHPKVFDLKISGVLESFTKPRFQLQASSSAIDVANLLNSTEASQKSASKASHPGGKGASTAAQESAEKSLDSLRKNAVLKETQGTVRFDLAEVKTEKVKLAPVRGVFAMKGLEFAIREFNAQVGGGRIRMDALVNVQSNPSSYKGKVNLENINLPALGVPGIEGVLKSSVELAGRSLDVETAKKLLSAKGSFEIQKAELLSADLAGWMAEALQKSMGGLAEKIPGLKDKKISVPASLKNPKYTSLKADFQIQGGVFKMPNFEGKAVPNLGLDLKGTTELGLVDESLKAEWMVSDTYDLTGASKVDASIRGVSVPKILADSDGVVRLPIVVGCKWTAPCPSYEKVPEYLAKNALKHSGGAAKSVAKEVLKDKAEDLGKKIFKGLFR